MTTVSFLPSTLLSFWQHNPALLYGIAALLGCCFALEKNGFLFFPLFCAFFPIFWAYKLPSERFYRLGLALLFGAVASIYSACTIKFPDPSLQKKIAGTAHFSIDNIRQASPQRGTWIYNGRINNFYHHQELIARNIPCSISLPRSSKRPPANCAYQIEGSLQEIAPQKYILIPTPEIPWRTLKRSWSFAEMRFAAKTWVSENIRTHISEPQSSNFLTAIATGEFQDRLLRYEFNRFGVQHIMAISGFHFTLIASIVSTFFSFFFSKKTATIFSLGILCSYFLFLGFSPSIARAWISSTIALSSLLVGRKSSGLNSLGIGLICVLIIDPSIYRSIGFQFSFAATGAILLLYPICDTFLQKIFPKRSLHQAIHMDLWTQHNYTFLSFFRQAIALDMSVNTVALPITLFYFQKFPLLSLFYNLFFPLMVSISIFLLLLAMPISLIFPIVGQGIYSINSLYTQFVLNYTYNIPSSFDIIFRTTEFSPELIIAELSALLLAAVIFKNYCQAKETISEML